MINFNFTNSMDFFFNVENKFIYNFYNKNESQVDDNSILDNNVNPLSFIELDISYKSSYDERIIEYNQKIDSLYSSIFDLSNKELTNSEILIFNKLSDEKKNIIAVNIDKRKKEIEEIQEEFNLSDKEEFNDAIDFLTTNKKVQVNREILEKFNNANKTNIFYTESDRNAIDKFKKVFRKNKNIITETLDFLDITDSLKPFKTTPISVFNSNFYYSCVGVFIEKYKIHEDKIEKKASKFFKSEKIFTGNSDLEFSESFSIKDNAVRYGEEYFYVLYPVYLMTLPKKDDYNFVETYAVCDYPYITKDILCKDFKRPVSPSKLNFKYDIINKSLRIDWSKPLESQGDIKGYQIFKRNSLDKPYTLIKQIEFFDKLNPVDRNENVSQEIIEKTFSDKSYCDDYGFLLNEIQIYTICAIDARGYTSNYSSQIAVLYNQKQKQLTIDLVSTQGAPLHMPNLLIPRKTLFFDNDDKIVSNTPYEEKVSKFTLYATPQMHSMFTDSNLSEGVIALGEKYKLNMFKLENGENFIKDIVIENFSKP